MEDTNKTNLMHRLKKLELEQSEYENARINLTEAVLNLKEANKENAKIKNEIAESYDGFYSKKKTDEIENIIQRIANIIKKQEKMIETINTKITKIKIEIEQIKSKLLIG